MQQYLLDASPIVVQVVVAAITRPTLILPEFQSAFECLQARMLILRAEKRCFPFSDGFTT